MSTTKKFIGSSEARYWRIRMKYESGDLSKSAWEHDKVGIWYGSWSAEDWSKSHTKQDQFRYLSNLPQPKGRGNFRKVDFDTANRFANIRENDWIVAFFDDSLHLARVRGSLKSSVRSRMNKHGEIFKYRKIVDKKSFLLVRLPDPYRLTPSAGRGNVHEFRGTNRKLIEFLAEKKNEKSVVRIISEMSIMEWLDILGPAQWESFCLGYLIKKEGFVPTGLGVGRTLPILDIVGRNKKDIRVIAQCKKNPNPISMPKEFIDVCNGMKKANIYFFAYNGITGNPKQVKVISRDDIKQWVEKTVTGRKYANMWYKTD